METEAPTRVKHSSMTRLMALGLLTLGGAGLAAAGFLFFTRDESPAQNLIEEVAPQPVTAQSGYLSATKILVKVKRGYSLDQIISKANIVFETAQTNVLSSPPPKTSGAAAAQGAAPLVTSVKAVRMPVAKTTARAKLNGQFSLQAAQIAAGLNRWTEITINDVAKTRAFSGALLQQAGVENAHVAGLNEIFAPRELPTDDPIGDAPPVQFPNDPTYWSQGAWGQNELDQWWLHRIHVDDTWATSTGSANVTVAVIDTGIGQHAELANRLYRNTTETANNNIDDDGNGFIDDIQGWNFAENTNDVTDLHGHGTHVAGIIGAASNNNQGIASVAWNAKILPIQGLNQYGSGWESDLAAGIIYATNQGASVINMSWGGTEENQPMLKDALQYAHDAGVVLVAAAGNSNKDVIGFYPASFPSVISVGAWTSDNTRASFSNFGQTLDIAAPGVEILSLRSPNTDMYYTEEHIVGDTFYRANGTSMAAPVVAGVVALMRSAEPTLSPGLIEIALAKSAEDVGAAGKDIQSGFGMVHATQAVTAATEVKNLVRAELVISTTSVTPTFGGKLIMKATVENIGSVASGATTVDFRDENAGTSIVSVPIGTILAGQKVSLTQTQTSPAQVVTITVDPTLQVPEFFDANNSSTIAVDKVIAGFPIWRDGYRPSSLSLVNLDQTEKQAMLVFWYDMRGDAAPFHLVDLIDQTGTSLPGWPNETPASVPSLSAADIDADGQTDIIALTSGSNGEPIKIYRWGTNGNLASTWPKSISPRVVGNSIRFWTDASLGNVQGDQKLEIVATWDDGSGLQLGIWDSDGNMIPQWPKPWKHAEQVLADVNGDGYSDLMEVTPEPYPSVVSHVNFMKADGTMLAGWGTQSIEGTPYHHVVADIDGDGVAEVVLPSILQNGLPFNERKGALSAWHRNGTPVIGWPVIVPKDADLYDSFTNIVAGDINNDHAYEVLLGTADSRIMAWKGDGQRVPGWNYRSSWSPNEWMDFSAALVDVTGDHVPEFAAMGEATRIHLLGEDGSLLPGWPSRPRYAWRSKPLVAGDLDGDHRVEFAFIDIDVAQIYVMTTTPTQIPGTVIGWPTHYGRVSKNAVYPLVPN